MIAIHLTGQHEKQATANPYRLDPPPLYHQMRTAEALQSHPLVMNAYNTGTGKTVASLLHLFELAGKPRDNVLFIAPTNELLHQHYEDICEFVAKYDLKFRPVEVNAAVLKSLGDDDVVDRGGEKFVRLIRSNGQDFHAQLGIDPSDHRKLPLILVTNPDLFYYAFFWQFAHHDQRNLFQQFVRGFRYIVIDEFHYYNSKQTANFLFFVALSKAWRYFDEGRRICLLSATPDLRMRTYLDLIFGDGGWALISPHNEPPDAERLPTIPTLAPLTLYLRSDTIDEYARTEAASLRRLLDEGKHGALIANALWRINQAYAALRTSFSTTEIGRITGAQPVEERRRDQFKPLILATPTVDIGYNFKKINKPRQNLDFVVFEAQFHDECIQRMGRAGRVLGKLQVDIPSMAVGLVGEDAVSKLRPFHEQTVSRTAFSRLLRDSGALPVRDDFDAYVRSGGLLENAYPIFRLREIYPEDRAAELEALFEQIRSIFAPDGGMSYRGMVYHWRRMRALDTWLRSPQNEYARKWLPKLVADFQTWLTGECYDEAALKKQMDQLLANRSFVAGFRLYCEMERARVRAQFTFRDSFSGPAAWVYDRDRLLSSAEVTQYDVIHLVENYELETMDRDAFTQATGVLPPEDVLCVRLRRHRSQRNSLWLRWRPPEILPRGWDLPRFRACFAAGEPVALRGLQLRGAEPPPREIATALTDRYVLALLTPLRIVGPLQRTIRYRAVYSRKLMVDLPDGEEEFRVLLGTASMLIAPLLRWAFQQSQRDDEAIII